jgi:DNA polymerase
MNGKEQLRRYLEQRKEAGEKDLVLDHMSIDDALALLGAAPRPAGGARSVPTADAGNWRDVLRERGAAPSERQVAPPSPAPSLPVAAPTPAAKPVALPDVQQGIIVGTAGRELFGGPMAELPSLDAIAQSVASCKRCPLHATALNPVPGSGNPNADLMVVGEAPGATEDEQGLPFVGAAGQLLTKILASVNLPREDVFICNVLKHRPPGNRNPMPDEVTACSPYLLRQFELIQPKAILALGTFAAQTLLQTKLAIGKLRNQVHRFYGVPLIVTYHPASLLRNPSWKRPTWEDVQLVRRILDSAIAQS